MKKQITFTVPEAAQIAAQKDPAMYQAVKRGKVVSEEGPDGSLLVTGKSLYIYCQKRLEEAERDYKILSKSVPALKKRL